MTNDKKLSNNDNDNDNDNNNNNNNNNFNSNKTKNKTFQLIVEVNTRASFQKEASKGRCLAERRLQTI